MDSWKASMSFQYLRTFSSSLGKENELERSWSGKRAFGFKAGILTRFEGSAQWPVGGLCRLCRVGR